MPDSSQLPGALALNRNHSSKLATFHGNPLTERWLHVATEVALVTGGQTITERDLAVALDLAGILGQLDRKLIAKPTWYLNRISYCHVCGVHSGSRPDQPLALDDSLPSGIAGMFQRLEPLPDCFNALLAERSATFMSLFGPASPCIALADPRRELWGAHEQARRVELELRFRLIGQSEAVRALSKLAFSLALRQGRIQAPAVALFLGPPGTGKTLAAWGLASISNGAQKKAVLEVDGTQHVAWASGTDLFGDGQKPGLISSFIAKHGGEALVIFNEVDRSHPKVLEALLPVLDRGKVHGVDGTQVDCCRSTFVFTSNLGRPFWDRPGQPEEGALVIDPVSLLELAEDPDEPNRPQLSKELVSRLSRGPVVLFRRHRGHHLLEMISRSTRYPFSGAGTAMEWFHHAGFTFQVEGEALQALVLAHLAGKDLRSASGFMPKFLLGLLQDAQNQFGSRLWKGHGMLEFKVVCSEDLRSRLREALGQVSCTAYLVSADPDLEAQVKGLLPALASRLCRVDTLGALPVLPPGSLVLIDAMAKSTDEPVAIPDGLDHLIVRSLVDAKAFRMVDVQEQPTLIPLRIRPQGGLAKVQVAGERSLAQAWATARFTRLCERSSAFHLRWRTHVEYRHYPEDPSALATLCFDREDRVLPPKELKREMPWAAIPELRLSDVLGLDAAKARLQEHLDWLRDPDAAPGLRACVISGPPGTGKTHLCMGAAGTAGVPTMVLGGAQFLNKWHGESERIIRETFAALQNFDASVLVIEEFDAIGWRRDGGSNWKAEVQSTIVGELLRSIDLLRKGPGKVILMANTNFFERLDLALVRSLRMEQIPVGLPNARERREMLREFLKDFNPDGLLEELVEMTTGMSPADLTVLAEKIRKATAEIAPPLPATMVQDLILELRRGERDTGLCLDAATRRRVACHEAGHALAAFILLGPSSIDHVSVIPSASGSLGAAYQHRSEAYHLWDRDGVERRLAVLMAGRAAETLCHAAQGPSCGAEKDLHEATRLAQQAVSTWGLDAELPNLSLDALAVNLQDALAPRVLDRVENWLKAAEATARRELAKHQGTLDHLTQALLEKETLHRMDLLKLLGNGSQS